MTAPILAQQLIWDSILPGPAGYTASSVTSAASTAGTAAGQGALVGSVMARSQVRGYVYLSIPPPKFSRSGLYRFTSRARALRSNVTRFGKR